MKKELPISKNYLVIIFSTMAIISIIVLIALVKRYFKAKTVTNTLIRQEIDGVIKSMKDESRGSYFLEIKTGKGLLSIHSLPVAWEVEKYNIQVGDSVSKKANSKTMNFYKSKNGVMTKVCEFEM
jgi:hypothetical protein